MANRCHPRCSQSHKLQIVAWSFARDSADAAIVIEVVDVIESVSRVINCPPAPSLSHEPGSSEAPGHHSCPPPPPGDLAWWNRTASSSAQKMMSSRQPILSAHKVVMMSITGLVALRAVKPQSVQGRSVTGHAGYNYSYICTIRDSDDALLSCVTSDAHCSGTVFRQHLRTYKPKPCVSVCLRFILEVSHVRWEPRKVPLRGARQGSCEGTWFA